LANDEDPVSRTRRQLQCYYQCVAQDGRTSLRHAYASIDAAIDDGELCEDCAGCDHHCECQIDFDDDDELGLPRY